MRRVRSFILSFILLTALWLLLAGSLDWQEAIVGAATALILSVLFARRLEVLGDFRLTPAAFIHGILYIFVFLWALLRSNLDVARRVVDPRLPISPGIVRVKTKLQSRLGRLALANSITLTPGTLTVETRGDMLYIHWIDAADNDIESSTQHIVHTFEKYLEVIFG